MLLGAEACFVICELDVELLGAFNDELSRFGADGVRDLAAEKLVLHEQKVELLKVCI